MLFLRKDNRNRLIKLILSLILFLFITIPVACESSFIKFLDTMLDGHVQSCNTFFLHIFYNVISVAFNPGLDILWALIIAGILWIYKLKIPAIWSMCLLISGDVINEIIKHLIKRPRPNLHPATTTGYSFPSTHVLSTFLLISIICVIVVPLIKRVSYQNIIVVVGAIIVILIMLSRIYVNAHFATDTFGACLLSYTWLQISEYLYIWLAPKLKQIKLLKDSII